MTDTARILAKTVSELAKTLQALSEVILEQGSSTVTHETEDEHKKIKRKKIEKDPHAPKRNLSSYMLYSQAVRNDTVREHPELKAVDIAKLIGEKWNNLSEKEKEPFVKQAEKEKSRFIKETNAYKADSEGDHKKSLEIKPEQEVVEPVKKKSKKDGESKQKSKKH